MSRGAYWSVKLPSIHDDAHLMTWLLQILDVLSGLSYLHKNNIVHGDIKGANVLVDSQGRACLADLGLSRLIDTQIDTWTSIQSTIAPWGTLLWQAPELLKAQLEDQEHLPAPTTFSDIYAFGCLAYEVTHSHAVIQAII